LDSLGAALEDKNDFRTAELTFTKAIELAFSNEATYYRYRRGEAYLEGNDIGMALADFKILVLQGDGYGYLGLGTIAAKEGRYAEAIAQDDKADSLRPEDDSMIFTARADAYALAGEYSKAIADDDAMAARYSSYGFAYNARCWDRALANRDLDTAIADCNLALGLQPDDPDTLDSRGLVRYREGRWDDAIADYNAALGHNPYFASSMFMRGMSELRKGESAAGHADIDKAESLRPGTIKEYALYGIAPP
jgi:tetratricopeptide (TPR) repeat protein